MTASPQDIWKNWSIQILVLFSLGCQITLFLCAGIRRRGGHPFRRSLLWLAYQLADFSATFALGHLSLTDAPREHVIVAFWAPFLLLHLGGPDNITAYSLEDNTLWMRHSVESILQVLGAVYVLYEHIADKEAKLRLATILMLAIGVIKYWERMCALRGGNLDSIRGSIKKQPAAMHGHFHPHDEVLDEESLVRRAHSLFHICKRAIVDYTVMEDDSHGQDTTEIILKVNLWQLMEIELSLMYDMLYTKAPVIHTCFGYLQRLSSPVAILASLLLFKFIDMDDPRPVDVVITYILYGGAMFMETTSLVNALGSSWTFAFLSTTRRQWLRYTALCNKRWDRLRRVVACLHHLVRVGGGSRYRSRSWTYTMTQYNMLHFCSGSDSALTRPLLGSLAKVVGQDELWNNEHYSWVIDMPEYVQKCISGHMQNMYNCVGVNSLGMLKNRWGEEPLARKELLIKGSIFKDSLGVEFQECIIIWHIGTDVFLAKSKGAKEEEAQSDVEAIKMISNYMMYLLVKQPDMLPGLPQNRLYQLTCQSLEKLKTRGHTKMKIGAMLKNLFSLKDDPDSISRVTDREDLAEKLYDEYDGKGFIYDAPRLPYVVNLVKELLTMEENCTVDLVLKLVLDVWMDILVYAGNKCSRKFHAEKLNSGGELTTILWLMSEHFYHVYAQDLIKDSKKETDVAEDTSPQEEEDDDNV
ncbi:hypothetical protein CFC21_078259 [Triticum aestivum]|uniref:DUF4220 domain-containing protein n=2 Tax=Triticum aestivum TaxID=4565 RepID=A0A9R1HWE1_WHEAT|nr:hypothetical protein CFC21_078259 [Triticum aestivum]